MRGRVRKLANLNTHSLAAASVSVAACLLSATLAVQAQTKRPPNTYRSTASDTTPTDPTQVNPDRTITFRLLAPAATQVDLFVYENQQLPMAKAANGVWTLTLGPLEPEVYRYTFVVDGVRVPDPSNTAVAIGRAAQSSIVDMPGVPPRLDQRQDVPRGALHIREYTSTVMNMRRRMLVYVPPQYDTEATRRFPVLYLRHGNGGSEDEWSVLGRAGVILDNLLAKQRAVPMIIVMPSGYPVRGSGSSISGIEETGRELLADIVPLVERTYRVLGDANHRAIAGLSMGAAQSFVIGLRNPDKFAWVGAFSTGIIGDAEFRVDSLVPGFLLDPPAVNKRTRLLFLSCGTEDPRYPGYLDLLDTLKEHNIRHEWFSTPGVHEWKVWRHSLAALLPMLFQTPTTRSAGAQQLQPN